MNKYIYKYKDNEIGKRLRDIYEQNNISSEDEFKEVLEYVLSSSKEV